MACSTGTLGSRLGGEELFVVGVRQSDGTVMLKKSALPPKVRSFNAHHLASMSVVFGAKDRTPSLLDTWHGMAGEVATIIVVSSFVPLMPPEVLCALVPCVTKMKAPLEDPGAVYEALMMAGLPPNQMRDLLTTSLKREPFYDAFHRTLPRLPLDGIGAFLSGCHDLCVTTLVLHSGTESSQRVLDYLLSSGIDRSCRMMICYNGVDLVPFSHQAMKDSLWRECKVPHFDFTPSKKRNDYFGATAKEKGLKDQKPTAGTVFVAAGVTRTPDKNTMLLIAMEVKPTVALSANGPPKCRVMMMCTVKVPRSHEAFRHFYAAASNLLTTLSMTNMASKGPIQPILTIIGTPEQAVEGALTLYRTGAKGLVLKWGNMFSEPHHFDEEPVTAEAVANHLAKHVCIKMGTVPVAELAMRVFYGSGKGAIDRDGTKLGIDVLLGRRIFYNMLNEIKLHIASSELEDEETVECIPFKKEFTRSFAYFVKRIYDPKLNSGFPLEYALMNNTMTEVCNACHIDVDIGFPMVAHDVGIIHTEMVYFPERSLRRKINERTVDQKRTKNMLE